MDLVREFTLDNFSAEVIDEVQPVMVDFWSPKCGPCQKIAPVIEELAAENLGVVKFGKLNVDAHKQVAIDFGVNSLPTLMLFQRGEVVERFVGLQPKARIQEALDETQA